ncbi:hypothetical protein NQZ68_008740, partial [Dissostichus eleginoides]
DGKGQGVTAVVGEVGEHCCPPERSAPHPPSHREQLPSGFHDNQQSCHRLCSENEGGKRIMPPSAEHHCLEQRLC